ncbi:unnamed protein product [Ceutorhynchus assimilis]|uniref:DUF8207 domain-containing protein n=1 Tax=Ceutorhynchus assimilis TaxID=467358 RepID=A0A9N9QQI7_9CUCU|nr:unnamed protein product [Ceutorhynchus assimilis]
MTEKGRARKLTPPEAREEERSHQNTTALTSKASDQKDRRDKERKWIKRREEEATETKLGVEELGAKVKPKLGFLKTRAVNGKTRIKHEKIKQEAPETHVKFKPKILENVEFQPTEVLAQTSANLKSDDDDDDDDEDVFYEPSLEGLKEDLQKSIHERSGAYEEFLDQYPKVAQEYVDKYYKDSDETDHSYGLKHDMRTDDWSMGSQKVKFLSSGDIKVGPVTYRGTQGLYDLLFLKKPLYQTADDKLQLKDILDRTNAHRRDFDPSKQVKGSVSSKYKDIYVDSTTLLNIWGKLPLECRKDFELQTRLPCFMHYNRPDWRTHVDGPPSSQNQCYFCIRALAK